MKPTLIGLAGAAGSGKDTAGSYLAATGYVRYSFALPIKLALNAMFGWHMEQWDDRLWKESQIPWLGKSPRQLAQTLGTEWGRDLINPQLWVLIAEQRYLELMADPSVTGMVITDVRFPNEAQFIKRHGGQVWQIDRRAVARVNAHVSESGVPAQFVTRIVYNSGSFAQLHAQLYAYLNGSAQLALSDPLPL